jgi:plastocyanin
MRVKAAVPSVLLAILLPLALAGCGTSAKSGSAKGASAKKLETYDFRFDPRTLSAKVGQQVTLTVANEGQAEHNFSITALHVDKDIEKGKDVTVTFTPTAAGTLQFFCEYHRARGMTGTIDVST